MIVICYTSFIVINCLLHHFHYNLMAINDLMTTNDHNLKFKIFLPVILLRYFP